MDWVAWHGPYADPESPLSRRLRAVQGHIAAWLDDSAGELRAVSVCAGQGNDLLGVLATRPDAARVRARLVELDETNVAAARAAAAELPGVEVLRADAGDLAAYRGAVPADLVLLAGVLGNVSDVDVRATIGALPSLCAPDATVIWTRTRRAPDLTVAIRRWFAESHFTERAFDAPADVLWSVGVHRFTGRPRPLPPAGQIFRFVKGGIS
jgi:hypothetical protein